MRVTFVLPAYFNFPIGGYKIVFEYANALAARGHRINIVLPREIDHPRGMQSPREFIRRKRWKYKTRSLNRPLIGWIELDPTIQLILAEDLSAKNIPEADVLIATGWRTAHPVSRMPADRGVKFYLIQHYEVCFGDEADVDATWRLDLNRIVISKWLVGIGTRLGVADNTHIPNAINFEQFRITRPLESRTHRIVSLNHDAEYKGVPDALDVLRRFHQSHPTIPVTMFGVLPRDAEIPAWVDYRCRPRPDELVDDIYNNGTIYLGASLSEGWSLPPAEAMACGCLFVGTDSGGVRDFAEDGVNALLSPPGDRDALLSNLQRAVDDKSLFVTLRDAGCASIGAFTWERSTTMLENHLATVLERSKGTATSVR